MPVFTTNRRSVAPSQLMCVEPDDLASVSTTVRSVSNSVRLWSPIFSRIVRRKRPLIARRTVHHCASLHLPTGRHDLASGRPRLRGHTAQARLALAKELRIAFVWLPRQWPELNAMDQLWKELKRDVAANR